MWLLELLVNELISQLTQNVCATIVIFNYKNFFFSFSLLRAFVSQTFRKFRNFCIVYDREASHSHRLPANRGGSGGGGDGGNGGGGQRLWLRLCPRLWWERLFGAGERRLHFPYVSEGQHRTEQRPYLTLQDRASIRKGKTVWHGEQRQVHTYRKSTRSVYMWTEGQMWLCLID